MQRILLALMTLLIWVPNTPAHPDPTEVRYENTLAKDFIMDAPWRVIDENTPIPVTIIIKDSDADDVRDLHWIRIWDETAGETLLWDHDFQDEELGDDASEHNFWTYITKVTENHGSLTDGTALTPANLGYSGGDIIALKVSIYYRDDWFNYTETRHLRVFVGSGPFPWPEDWFGGDVHYHTMYTNNIYEYGAPLPAVKETALALGLNWLTTTDHSCDLDETGDGTYSYATRQWEYTLQDVTGTTTHYRDVAAAGSSWNGLGNDVVELDSPEFRLFRGVELNMASVDPATLGKTLHCLVYNDQYIHSPDSGAPGERPVSPDIDLALAQIQDQGFAYCAHPLDDLGSEFLGMDFGANGTQWGQSNITQALTHEVFRGLQIFNTRRTVTSNDQNNPWSDFAAGVAVDDPYPEALLAGIDLWDGFLASEIADLNLQKLFISGGSDAHGDFNYSSHMGVDDYAEDNGIGKVQTVALVPGNWTRQNLPPMADLMASYRAGHTIVTDGPFLEIGVDTDGDGQWYGPDDLIIGDDGVLSPTSGATVHLRWASLPEFGLVSSVRLMAVDATGTRELAAVPAPNPYNGTTSYALTGFDLPDLFALRAELVTEDGLAGHRAYTNPIWIVFNSLVPVSDGSLPDKQTRLRNTPNPFNPRTRIQFYLGEETTVRLNIYASNGSLVRQLLAGVSLVRGEHGVIWDGCDNSGQALPSGVYLYRVTTATGEQSGKMSLVR